MGVATEAGQSTRRVAWILSTYPSLDASTRLRILPLQAGLRSCGWTVRFDSVMSGIAYKWKNERGWRRVVAAALVGGGLARRMFVAGLARGDLLVVHREAFPFFVPAVERWLSRRFAVSIVDIDDAIYTQPTHGKDWRRLLRDPARALEFARIFSWVIAGNAEVAATFQARGANVLVAPTCPEPERRQAKRNPTRTVAWIGSQSTLINLEAVLVEVLAGCEAADATLVVLGGANVDKLPAHPRLVAQRWSAEAEARLLSEAALGIMPLSGSEWDQGKSAYKAVLYLVSGVSAMVTPVGENALLAKRFPRSVLPAELWAAEIAGFFERGAVADEEEVERARRDYDTGRHVSRLLAVVAG